jgi:hypothetical protein
MLQNHHAVSKYDKDEIWSAVSVLYIKETVLLREKTNSDIYIPFAVVNILGIPVLTFRTEGNYTSLPELMHRQSSGILKLQLMRTMHFLCKN